jgi:hypothetical protein
MLTTMRLLPAIALFAAGCVAADAWRRHSNAKAEKARTAHDIKTWEGEGGNLPPGSSGSNTPEPETSLATSAP